MPVQAALDTCEAVADFVIYEFNRRSPKSARIILHGGEPMLMKAKAMDDRLVLIYSRLAAKLDPGQLSRIRFALQTNATLVNSDWRNLLAKWRIQVGVSLDGPREVHNRQRVDKRGRGTYDQVIKGLNYIREDDRLEKEVGVICVVDPLSSGADVYNHITKTLGIGAFSFLLPFMNWDNRNEEYVAGAGAFYAAAFREWRKDMENGKAVYVRVFYEAIRSYLVSSTFDTMHTDQELSYEVYVVDSDGTIMTEESLRPSFIGRFSEMNVKDTTLSAIAEADQFVQVAQDTFSLSDECAACALLKSCRSGSTIGRVGMRYSSSTDKLRKSVYCEAFIDLYIEVAAFVSQHEQEFTDIGLEQEMIGILS